MPSQLHSKGGIDPAALAVASLAAAISVVAPAGPYGPGSMIIGTSILLFIFAYDKEPDRSKPQHLAFSAVCALITLLLLGYPLELICAGVASLFCPKPPHLTHSAFVQRIFVLLQEVDPDDDLKHSQIPPVAAIVIWVGMLYVYYRRYDKLKLWLLSAVTFAAGSHAEIGDRLGEEMPKDKDVLTKLIYLDSDFISSNFEVLKKVSPETQFSKTEGMKADGGFPVLKAGIHSQETKTFKLSSLEMLVKIYDELKIYPTFQPQNFKNYEGTQTVWIEGQLTVSAWQSPGESDKLAYKLFEIKADTNNIDYSLLVQPESFSSNIGGLLTASLALRANIGIPVKALGRVLYFVEDISSFVTCPYLILEP